MSKITLEPNDSGAGTFSIVSPDSNINRTLNLPDASGTVLTDVSDLDADKLTGSVDSSLLTRQDFISFGSTVPIVLGESTPIVVTYDRVLLANPDMSFAFGTTVNDIPPHHWKHTQAGYYRLSFGARTTDDRWRMMSVCKNNDLTLPVGSSVRMGSTSGSFGYVADLLYKVDNTEDAYGLFFWARSGSSGQASFPNAPPAGFVAPPQDGGLAPSEGYYASFSVNFVSNL